MKVSHYARKQKDLIVISVVVTVLMLSVAIYHCGIQKVCKVEFIERIVRHEKVIGVPQGKLFVEIVDTEESREQGLSGRTGLRNDEGMLFVFDASGRYGFWMKDMLFPLDIIWINKDGIVVHIERNVTPGSYFNFHPPHTFVNGPFAKYVLEINASTTDKYGLYLGTKVEIPE